MKHYPSYSMVRLNNDQIRRTRVKSGISWREAARRARWKTDRYISAELGGLQTARFPEVYELALVFGCDVRELIITSHSI